MFRTQSFGWLVWLVGLVGFIGLAGSLIWLAIGFICSSFGWSVLPLIQGGANLMQPTLLMLLLFQINLEYMQLY
jgi:hypothetical protein